MSGVDFDRFLATTPVHPDATIFQPVCLINEQKMRDSEKQKVNGNLTIALLPRSGFVKVVS